MLNRSKILVLSLWMAGAVVLPVGAQQSPTSKSVPQNVKSINQIIDKADQLKLEIAALRKQEEPLLQQLKDLRGQVDAVRGKLQPILEKMQYKNRELDALREDYLNRLPAKK